MIQRKHHSLARQTIRPMTDPGKPTEGKDAKPSRLDAALRIIEEYAADLREIVRQLRRKMN
ncbi:hypothetical protein [Bradyrhizobium liaoningense]|uniref:hypothetical protein n=1 Tax=Bradyrhizobium liaoningense TaxID=43992 RepID=UPI001BA6D14D|nr:hypothetical protein [Bradyrhizobium liaoningense]MBR0709556.1 hypothetical protein [Bradyrhizobium liaoningense]